MNQPTPHSQPGAGGDDRLGRFERLLRQDVDAAGVDWATLEKSLLARIRAAEDEGPLLALKADIIPPAGLMDRVESSLCARIHSRREYEEPINDVIAGPEGLSAPHWQRLECKLEERIHAAERLSPWERALKAADEPSPGRWETIEASLQGRIDAVRSREPWEQALKADEVPSPGGLEALETRLLARIDGVRQAPAWEQALKAGRDLPAGRWEAMEENLLARMERHRKFDALATRPLWLSLGFYLSRAPARIGASMLLVLGLGLGAFRWWQEANRPIDTFIYQAQGAAAGDLDSALSAGRFALAPGGRDDVQAKEDGSVVVVNQRGFVDLRNGSRVKIEKADARKVHYRVAFAGKGKAARGNVTFFVNKPKRKQAFTVTTPDYRIEVLGTYFRVDPDLGGRVSTAVLEGKVRIHSEAYGDYTLEAGQILVYDPATGRYRVQDGGRAVPRETIESVPGPEELGGFGILSVGADAPRAEVRIDGRYRGLTPLVVLMPPGPHSLHLRKEGHAAYDTMVTVAPGATSRLAARLALLPPPPEPEQTIPKPVTRAVRLPEPPVAPPPPAVPEDAARLFHRADEAQASDWRLAVDLYTRVLEHPHATGMRKEAAQFSIARLRADNETDKSRAKEDFLRYLALHPDGAFAGESWMRLAELEVGRDPDKAIEYYLRCIAKFPRHHRLSELQHRVGLIYLQNRRYDEAIGMFRQSLGNVVYDSEAERKRIYGSLYRALMAKGDRRGAELIDPQYRPEDAHQGR